MRIFEAGAREGSEVVSDRLLTVPNVLSVLRLLVLPVVFYDLVNGNLVRALVVAFVFGATDWVDGYVARRLGQVSRFGQIMDPIADRALVIVVGVGFILAGVMPLWAVLLLFVRDGLVVLAGGIVLLRGARPPAVTRIGKAATFGLMWALAFFLLAAVVGDGVGDPEPIVRGLAWVTYGVNTVLYYVAAGQYARAVVRGDPEHEGTELATRAPGESEPGS